MKSSRQLSTNPKATTCVYLKAHNARFSASIHPLLCTHKLYSAQARGTADWKYLAHSKILNCINKTHDSYSQICAGSRKTELCGCIQPFIWASISFLVTALVRDKFNLLMCFDAYLCLRVCTCTLLLRICLLLFLWYFFFRFFSACGHIGMEHGHSATELSSEKRFWVRPAVQYLESVFMRGTTTANSITALCFMFICFAPYCSHFSSRSFFTLRNKKVHVKKSHTTPWSELRQPTLRVAERACSSCHHKDVTLKLTTKIIIRPYFSDEFV